MKFRKHIFSWLLTLMTAALALAGAVAVGCKKDETPKPEPGPESGVYYFDATTSEYTETATSSNSTSAKGRRQVHTQ